MSRRSFNKFRQQCTYLARPQFVHQSSHNPLLLGNEHNRMITTLIPLITTAYVELLSIASDEDYALGKEVSWRLAEDNRSIVEDRGLEFTKVIVQHVHVYST